MVIALDLSRPTQKLELSLCLLWTMGIKSQKVVQFSSDLAVVLHLLLIDGQDFQVQFMLQMRASDWCICS